ncbi:hypothetical protein [Bdellovibrio sp. HCB337]|uniref:hypothetical protein n=1 Tax=Bdellovibrio sp. HCB337 TaxID=3394358 RepID=UPI0039A762AA
MKKAIVISVLMLLGAQANADIFLQAGESISLGRDTIYCGVQEREPSYYCTIEATFDGTFSGEGKTQLEAEFNAKQACKKGGRNNGFFCDEKTLTCQRSD